MNYEEMSDFDINKCVAEAVGMELSSDHSGAYVGVVRRSIGSRPNYAHVNYCNNPSDAWPIIFGNEISLVNVDDALWVARYGSVYSEGKNPLRAAMIVFLMMQEQAK